LTASLEIGTATGGFIPSLSGIQESREVAEKKEEERRALLREHRKVERELVKQGKKPYFIKKCKHWMCQVHQVVKP